jgi:hypothetical protein
MGLLNRNRAATPMRQCGLDALVATSPHDSHVRRAMIDDVRVDVRSDIHLEDGTVAA